LEKSEKIWMDGRLVPWHEANVHVLTHTLHYGLGVFEGIRCYNSKENGSAIFRLQEHVDRLFQSAVILGIKVPFSNNEIHDAIIQVDVPLRHGRGELILEKTDSIKESAYAFLLSLDIT
jgi:branched-chain amino acid aminotransferase